MNNVVRCACCKPLAGALLLARKIELVDRVQRYAVGDLVKCGDIGCGVVEYFGPHAVRISLYFVARPMFLHLGYVPGTAGAALACT
jgi:hypothetical protein